MCKHSGVAFKSSTTDLLDVHKISGGSQLLSAVAHTFQQSRVSWFIARCTQILQQRNTLPFTCVLAIYVGKKSKLHRSLSSFEYRGFHQETTESSATETMLVMNGQNNLCSSVNTGHLGASFRTLS